MADRAAVVKLWAQTLADPREENRAALSRAMHDDIVSVSPLGTAEAKDAVLAALSSSPIAALLAQSTWSDPAADGDDWTISCRLPPAAPIGGLTVRLSFDPDGLITRADTTVEQAAPPEAQPLVLSDAIRDAVNGALLNGTPVVVAYVDTDGRPHQSPRGSTQVFSDDQLAIWVRNPEGGLLAAIGTNPNLSLFYRDGATRTTYQFWGRAHVATSDDVRQTVYASAPEIEQNLDAAKRGVAVVVDVDRVQGRDANGPVLMERT
jgi:hypothetical protein